MKGRTLLERESAAIERLPPRVQILYERTVNGVTDKVELPMVIGVLADLSGRPVEALDRIGDRAFVDVDIDSFNSLFRECRPRVAFEVADLLGEPRALSVEIHFTSLADFDPPAIARQLQPIRQVFESRDQGTGSTEHDEGEAKFVQLFTDLIQQVIHHKDFQTLERSWRGLHFLVSQAETDEKLKIRVFNTSKLELSKTLKKYRGIAWDQSPLFKRIYEDGIGQPGGEPYSCLVIDYYFHHSLSDVDTLSSLAKIAAAARAPFVTGVSPELMQFDFWKELQNPRDLKKIFSTPEYHGWRSLRASKDSKYLATVFPRVLGRLPHVCKIGFDREFTFREQIDEQAHENYCWINSAYALAANMARAFKRYGWHARMAGMERGGTIDGLLENLLTNDSCDHEQISLTEVGISNRRQAEISSLGLICVVNQGNKGPPVVIDAPSLHEPAESDDPDATKRSQLGA